MTGTNGSKPAPILDLDDLTEPLTDFKLDDKRYMYVRWGSLGLLDRNRIRNRYDRILKLEALDEPTKEDADEYSNAVRVLLKLVTVDVPDDVFDGMDDEQKSEIYSHFLAWRLVRISDLQEKREKAAKTLAEHLNPPISASPSPASIASGRKKASKSG